MSASEHTVPIALVSQLVNLVKRWDIRPAELLSAGRMTEKALDDPIARVPVPTMCALLER